jgi:hypothetical protein
MTNKPAPRPTAAQQWAIAPGRPGAVASMGLGSLSATLLSALFSRALGAGGLGTSILLALPQIAGALMLNGKSGAFFAGGAMASISQVTLYSLQKLLQQQAAQQQAGAAAEPKRNAETISQDELNQAMQAIRNAGLTPQQLAELARNAQAYQAALQHQAAQQHAALLAAQHQQQAQMLAAQQAAQAMAQA